MTQSTLPESTAPLCQRWTVWIVFLHRPTRWRLLQIGDRPRMERVAEQAAVRHPRAELLVLPPLERPLMPRELCHRKRG